MCAGRGRPDFGIGWLSRPPLRDILPIRTPDDAVIAKAQQLEAILVSLNGDFSDIVAYPPSVFCGIISLQLHNHPETIPYVMKALLRFLTEHPERDFYLGKLLSVEAHRIRIRS
jgi:hypothetical protein